MLFQEYLSAVEAAEKRIGELRTLNSQLQDQASDDRKSSLENEQAEIEARLRQVHEALQEKVSGLSSDNDQWDVFYDGLKNFRDWLDVKEAELNKIHRGSVTPDQQYEQATVRYCLVPCTYIMVILSHY